MNVCAYHFVFHSVAHSVHRLLVKYFLCKYDLLHYPMQCAMATHAVKRHVATLWRTDCLGNSI